MKSPEFELRRNGSPPPPHRPSGIALFVSLMAAISVAMIVSATSPTGDRDVIVRPVRNLQSFPDASGEFQTFSNTGSIDTTGPFFQDLGSNGRRCVTCHQPDDAWTITPAHIRRRFEATEGNDPLFRANDGSNCAGANIETLEARRAAFSMLLDRGLIRVGMPVPADAEFAVVEREDPYRCSKSQELSVYRRPLPSTNVSFLTTVMWDGRETVKGRGTEMDLFSQARDATLGHAQAESSPTEEQLRQIVAFETALFTSQTRDERAGSLLVRGARGGPIRLSEQDFFPGINDPLGGNPSGRTFTSRIFDLFEAWDRPGLEDDPPTFERPINLARGGASHADGRSAIVRGERVFNTKPMAIVGVAGLNDALGVKVIPGFCGTCHDSPNVGHHSVPAPLDLGLTDASRRTADLPLFTLKNNATGELRQTTDPGRALVTGKWADIGKFKGPILRGVAARAPYFHDGSAATLRDVVDFYDTRFQVGLTETEKEDLVAFLRAL